MSTFRVLALAMCRFRCVDIIIQAINIKATGKCVVGKAKRHYHIFLYPMHFKRALGLVTVGGSRKVLKTQNE